MEQDINAVVAAAQNGSKEALETIVNYAQGYIYNLSLRMLQLPADAEDATQEILIKLITHLAQFRGDSSFATWMYRVASNYLLNVRKRDREKNQLSFDGLSLRLEESLARHEESAEETYENAELVEEVKRNCTLGMLMCLNREDRLALVLGELFEVSSEDGASIMGISPTAYRKRLSRARQAIVAFVSGQCGIVNPDNPCRCHKHVRNKIQAGLMNPTNLHYAQPHDEQSALNATRAQQSDLDGVCRTVALLRAHPAYPSDMEYREILKQILTSGDPDL